MPNKIHNGSTWKNFRDFRIYTTVWKKVTKSWLHNGLIWRQWYPEYPVNTAAPSISGSTTQGSTLSVTTGSWNSDPAYAPEPLLPATYTYQWKRAGVNISGATSSTYTTVVADIGNSITCTVTANNYRGATPANSSNGITVITATYTISYSGNGNTSGSAPTSPTTVNNGSTFTTPSNTYSRTGHTFAGWLSSQDNNTYSAGSVHPAVTGNLTLYALWSANTQTISYAGNGNTSGSAPTSPTTVSYGSTFTTPSNSYVRTGYTFAGWLSSQNSTTYSAGVTHPAATGNITLTAQWTVNSYSISYAGNSNTGGSAPTSPTTVNHGSTFTTPSNTYTRTGYNFAGWLSSQNSTVYAQNASHPAATGNITLTAQWTIIAVVPTISSLSITNSSTLTYVNWTVDYQDTYSISVSPSTGGTGGGSSFSGTNDNDRQKYIGTYTAGTTYSISLTVTSSTGHTDTESTSWTAPGGSGGGTAPATPTGLTACNNGSGTSLSWNAVSGATSYELWYQSSATQYTGDSADYTGITTSSTSVSTSGNFYWFVRARNASGVSAYSVGDFGGDSCGGGGGDGAI
jgi:uncharacterized repeat protein (TIGR02543 family)